MIWTKIDEAPASSASIVATAMAFILYASLGVIMCACYNMS